MNRLDALDACPGASYLQVPDGEAPKVRSVGPPVKSKGLSNLERMLPSIDRKSSLQNRTAWASMGAVAWEPVEPLYGAIDSHTNRPHKRQVIR